MFGKRWICFDKRVQKKLKRPIQSKQKDDLEDCINSIFNNVDTIDNDNGDNDVVAIDGEDGIANDGEVVETIHDDYNFNNTVDDQTFTPSNHNNLSNAVATVNKLGLSNIFNLDHDKMVEMKIP